jgi:branched-chain amino acid transport system permease protein
MLARLVVDRGLGRFSLLRLVAGGALGAALVGAAVVAWLALTEDNSRSLLISAGISAILVVAYQSFVGNTGIVSFGHMAFMGFGAYAAGILAVPVEEKAVTLPDLPGFLRDHSVGLLPAMLLAGLAAAAVALPTGYVLMRLTGAAAGITTLGLLVIANEVFRNAESFTRGTQTFFGVPESTNVWWVYGTLVACVAASLLLKFSPFGLRARAVREDALAAETAGIDVVRARLWPWVFSAYLTGVAGALWAHQLTAFSPRSFFIAATVPVIVMAVLGGIGSVMGAVVGTILLTSWLELIRRVESGRIGSIDLPDLTGIAQLSVGIGLILVLWRRRSGVMGASELELGRRPRQES